jgi:uncharacterized protein DUF6178
LMEEIYWGVEAELEEQAYQFRNSRLADHGFPDYYDAQAVFAYLNPRQFVEIRAQYVPPVRDTMNGDENDALPPELAPTLPDVESSLFNTALTAGFAAQGARQLRSEMALVSNQVLVARAVDFGDPEAVRNAVEMTHDYLNLALEHLAGGELDVAIEHLRDTHLKLLFRLGVSLTIDLRKRASEIMKSLGLDANRTREVPYLDSPYRETLAGLLQRQPQYFSGLDGAGAMTMRNFHAMRDIHLSYALLEQIEAASDLFKQLVGLDLASAAFRASVAGHEIRLSQILLTALIHNALERRLHVAPIAADQLNAVATAIMTPDRPSQLNEGFRCVTEDVLARTVDEAARRRATPYVDSCLRMLEEEFSELDLSVRIDPRFMRSFLIRA